MFLTDLFKMGGVRYNLLLRGNPLIDHSIIYLFYLILRLMYKMHDNAKIERLQIQLFQIDQV